MVDWWHWRELEINRYSVYGFDSQRVVIACLEEDWEELELGEYDSINFKESRC